MEGKWEKDRKKGVKEKMKNEERNKKRKRQQ